MEYVMKKPNPEVDPLFESSQRESMRLVKQIDGMPSTRRSWTKVFVQWLHSAPDLDYVQYQRLESKRTRQQMRRESFF